MCLSQARVRRGAYGIGECANRKLRLGLSRCKLVFLEAVFTSRDGRVCVSVRKCRRGPLSSGGHC